MVVSRHFIFGYGSLICPLSREITAPSLSGVPAQPALIFHMERTWSARITKPNLPSQLEGWTAMGVRFREGKKCSGVLIEVNEEELRQFDRREKGYDRRQIELEHIHRVPNLEYDPDDEDHVVFRKSEYARRMNSLRSDEDGEEEEKVAADDNLAEEKQGQDGVSPDAFIDTTLDVDDQDDVNVWVYVQRDATPANKNYPIKQSYVDIILRGCLSISKDFARSFLDTTHGWWHDGKDHYHRASDNEGNARLEAFSRESKVQTDESGEDDDHHTWIEDRQHGLYVRADPEYSNSMGHKLDELVKEHHPEALDRRKKFSVDSK